MDAGNAAKSHCACILVELAWPFWNMFEDAPYRHCLNTILDRGLMIPATHNVQVYVVQAQVSQSCVQRLPTIVWAGVLCYTTMITLHRTKFVCDDNLVSGDILDRFACSKPCLISGDYQKL